MECVGQSPVEYLTTLVYELLDAHEDTLRLAAPLSGDPQWAAHADYLRGLQRVGREALAEVGLESERVADPPPAA